MPMPEYNRRYTSSFWAHRVTGGAKLYSNHSESEIEIRIAIVQATGVSHTIPMSIPTQKGLVPSDRG